MKQGLKRCISLLLALVMVLSLPALAVEELSAVQEQESSQTAQVPAAEPETEPEGTGDQQAGDAQQPAEAVEQATEAVEQATEAVEQATEAVEQATEQPTQPAADQPAEQATEPVTEQVTEPVTEQATQPVTEQAAESVTEQATEAPTEQPTQEQSPYLDQEGRYLAPERLVVCTTLGMDDVLAEGEQAPAPSAENRNDEYTGVVAFYDYFAEERQEDEALRYVQPWFFYYEKGVLQQELPAFVAVKGYLDLRTPAVAESVLFPQSEEPVTEAAEQVTEAAEQVTEAAEQVTEAAGQVTEAAEQVTEAAEQVTEAAGQVTEAREQVTEAAGQVTEAAEQEQVMIYVGREVYVDAAQAEYLFAFNVEGMKNGPFTGTFEEKQYQNGLAVVEQKRALVGETTLTVQAAEDGVVLNWNAVDGTSGARIFRAVGAEEAVALSDSAGTTYTDTTAVAGTTYTYSVRMYLGAADAMAADTDYANAANWSNPSAAAITYLATPAVNFTITDKAITVKWAASAGAAQYQVLRSEEGADWVLLGVTAATSYTDNKAVAGKHYFYTVRAKKDDSLSPLKDTRAAGTAVCIHGIPVLKLSVVTNGVNASWNRVPGATGYRVLRKAASEKNFSAVANLTSGTTVTWKDTTVKNGTKYQYAVLAYFGKAANLKKAAEDQLWFSDKQVKEIVFLGFTSVASGNGVLNLKWSAAGVTGYEVNYRTGKTGAWKNAGKVTGKTALAMKNVKTNTPYYLAIRTFVTKNGKTTYSNWSITSEPAYYHAPLKVAVGARAKGILVFFNTDSAATGYRVYRTFNGKTTAMVNLPARAGAKNLSWVDANANLTSGKTYKYTVRAYYGKKTMDKAYIGTGDDWSFGNWETITYLSIPVLRTAQNARGGVAVGYNQVPGATGYTIYRKQGATGKWKAVGKVNKGSITKFTDTSVSKLTSGQPLFYTVRATGSGKTMSYYNETGTVCFYLEVPNEVKVNLPTSNGTALRWKAVKGANAYRVYRKYKENGSWELVATTVGTEYVDTDTTKKTPVVRYTVRALGTYQGRTHSSFFNEAGFSYGILWKGSERNAWVKKNGDFYYVDSSGFVLTGWQYIKRNGETYKYYFEEKTGVLVTNMYSYFGAKMRNMKSRIQIFLNNNDDYASHVNILLYDNATDSYCIPAVSFRCIGSLSFTTQTSGAYLIAGSGFERWVDTMGSGVYERYATRIKGASGYFHSVIYTTTNKYGMMRGSYSSMARNVNDSNGCVRLQCIYAFLIQDIMKNGYGRDHSIPVSITKYSRDLGPYGIPKVDTIPRSQRYDPTDPDVTGKFFYDTQIKCGGEYIKVTAGAPTWSYY